MTEVEAVLAAEGLVGFVSVAVCGPEGSVKCLPQSLSTLFLKS